MIRNIVVGALASLVLSVHPAAAAERLTIVGTGDGVAVLGSVGKAFTEKTGTEVVVPKSIGSGGGIKAVGGDKTPLGRVAREIKEKEQHFGLTRTPFVKIPTVFFVNSSVGIDGLTAAQVIDIYSGKIASWKDVGGGDRAINVLRREEGDSSLKNLQKSFPGFKNLAITEQARTMEKTPLMVKAIANLEDSIGFGPMDVAIANDLKVLKIDGKAPTDDGYPTLGEIALIYKEANFNGDLKAFVEFAISGEAVEAIKSAGGIPLAE